MPKRCIECGCEVFTLSNVAPLHEDRKDYVAICIVCKSEWGPL